MTLPTSGEWVGGRKSTEWKQTKRDTTEIKKEGRGGGKKIRGEWNKQRTMREKRVPEARNEKLQGWRRNER